MLSIKTMRLIGIQSILESRVLRSRSFSALVIGVIALTLPALDSKVRAQTNPSVAPGAAKIAVAEPSEDARYKIGPGDVLAVIVRKAPELSMEAVRVDQRGMIRIPMMSEEVFAACRTENELAIQIATLYLEYKKNPSVEVFVREFQSRPVSVIGAVNQPGQFRLQRQVRLLELLSFAGGPSDKAGRIINVIHTAGPDICQNSQPQTDTVSLQGLGVYALSETLKGTESSNPFVLPGDIVSLPDADQVFVVGHVFQPRSIPLKDKAITISRAIAMAGGPQRDAKTDKIRIVRQDGDSGSRQEIFVDLKAIQSQKAPDIALLPNDIVEVGTSTGKTILNILTGAVPAAITNGAIRAIP